MGGGNVGQNLWKMYGKIYGKSMAKCMENLWIIYGKIYGRFYGNPTTHLGGEMPEIGRNRDG